MNNVDRLTSVAITPQAAQEIVRLVDSVPAPVAALTALTDSSGGTAGATIAAVPGTYTQATLANQLASLTAKVNAIIAALKA